MEEKQNYRGDFPTDIDEGWQIKCISSDEFEDRVLEIHHRKQPHDRRHVDLQQEEYTPEEVARLLGTPREVVLQAVRRGELKAERKGHSVVCITHEDVVQWLRNR